MTTMTIPTYRVELTCAGNIAVLDVPSLQGAEAAGRRAFWSAVAARWADVDQVAVTSTELLGPDGPDSSHLPQEGDSTTGVIRWSMPDDADLPFGWECRRCDSDSGRGIATVAEARAAFDEHECVFDACPECDQGVLEDVGRMERDTGHQPFACNAGCGYRG